VKRLTLICHGAPGSRQSVRGYRHIANSFWCGTSPVLKKGTEMPKKKKRIRRTWTKDDLRLLKSMARDKQGVTKIAKALKRTPGATSVMAAKRGISLSMRG
jgi:hypothetical protein